MGALTYKSFPFELRGWDIQKKVGINPTDSLGLKVNLLINNNKIIQVEPINKKLNFINDKTRQFFDCFNFNLKVTDFKIEYLIKFYVKSIYFFDLYNFQKKIIYSFIIIFENISIDMLSLLTFFEQKYFFIKLIRYQQKNNCFDIENNLLLNDLSLKKTNVSLLIGTNVNFECTNLSLKLKQKKIKGNFKLFSLSSNLKDNIILGSSLYLLKNITEGTHFICQDFFMKNMLIITNSNLLKRNDSFQFLKLLTYFKKLQKFCDLNSINSSIYETSIFLLNSFLNYFNCNFLNFSLIYALNTTCFFDNFFTYKLQHKNYFVKNFKILKCKKIINLQENYFFIQNQVFNLPVKNFFETSQIFISNKGVLNQTKKILNNESKKSYWKFTRYFFNSLKKNSFISNNFLISFTKLTNQFSFKNVFYLFFVVLNNLNIIKNYTNSIHFFNIKLFDNYKKIKILNSKIKLWLNDFFIGGLDSCTFNSLVLIKCSTNYKIETSTFF